MALPPIRDMALPVSKHPATTLGLLIGLLFWAFLLIRMSQLYKYGVVRHMPSTAEDLVLGFVIIVIACLVGCAVDAALHDKLPPLMKDDEQSGGGV